MVFSDITQYFSENIVLKLDIYYYILLLIIVLLFKPIIKPFLKRLTKLTKTNIDDKIVESISTPVWIFLIIIVLEYLFEAILNWSTDFINNLFKTVEIFLGAYIFYKTLVIVLNHLEIYPNIERKMLRTAIDILENLSKIIVLFLAFLMVLSVWGIDITPLLASAGLFGLAVGFALKDIIQNVLSGILIFLDPPFKVGDIVDIGGYIGEVKDIGIRNTKIKTFDNRVITIPNSDILSSKIINYNLPDDIVRVSLKIGVSYDSDPEYIKNIVLNDILKNVETILSDPKPEVLFMEYGDSALIFEIRFWVYLKDKIPTIDKVNTLIWKIFKEKGIEIPFPIRTVYLYKKE